MFLFVFFFYIHALTLYKGQMRSALPGVIEGVPLSRVGVATVGSVVTSHGGARVVRHGIQVVHCIYCKLRHKHKKNVSNSQSKAFLLTQTIKSIIIRKPKVALTAVFRRKLPQVEVLHGEVDKGGQLARSSSFRETLQVFARQESKGRTTSHINT